MKTIILAAGLGRRLKGITSAPKCLLKIKKEPLIIRSIRLLKKFNIKNITVIVGYKANVVAKTIKSYRLKVNFIKNNDFTLGSILSLGCALKKIQDEILIMDGDIYFEEALIKKIAESKKNNFFLIDSRSRKDREAVRIGFKNGRAVALKRGLKGSYDVLGEWAGFLKLSSLGAKKLKRLIERKINSGEKNTGYEFVIPELFKDAQLSYELIDGLQWIEIDYPKDIIRARGLNIN